MLALSIALIITYHFLFRVPPFRPPHLSPGVIRGLLPSQLALCSHLPQPLLISFPRMSDPFSTERQSVHQIPSNTQTKRIQQKFLQLSLAQNWKKCSCLPYVACLHLSPHSLYASAILVFYACWCPAPSGPTSRGLESSVPAPPGASHPNPKATSSGRSLPPNF